MTETFKIPEVKEKENYKQRKITFESYCEKEDRFEKIPPPDNDWFPTVEELKKHHVYKNLPKYANFLQYLLLTEEKPGQKEARKYMNECLQTYYIITD